MINASLKLCFYQLWDTFYFGLLYKAKLRVSGCLIGVQLYLEQFSNVWFQKYSYTHLKEGHWKFRGRGGSEAKIFKEKYEAKLEIPGGRGSNQKNLLWEVWIFSGTTQWLT